MQPEQKSQKLEYVERPPLKRQAMQTNDPQRAKWSDLKGSLKSFASPDAVNTTTSPQLPKYVSAAFGSLALPWKSGHLRSAYDRYLLPPL
jgi:hypothetical protein